MSYRNLNDDRELAVSRNVAENGRWGTLAMVACAIAAGDITMAVLFALTLFVAYLAECFEDPLRAIGVLASSAWFVVALIVFLVRLWM